MLDQNTDRMWYVIGAVLIGAAVILIANGSIPQIFASVTNSFKDVSDDVVHTIEGFGENLLDDYVIYQHNYGTIDKSQYNSHGIIHLSASAPWDGLYLKMSDLELKDDTPYVLRYTFEKTDGTIRNIGGHTDSAFDQNVFHLDGVEQAVEYDLGPIDDIPLYAQNYDQSIMVDDFDKHTVEVSLKTPEDYNNQEDLYNGRISIQPNRGFAESVSVKITDLEFVEVLR